VSVEIKPLFRFIAVIEAFCARGGAGCEKAISEIQ
jgi:hypothetical protein